MKKIKKSDTEFECYKIEKVSGSDNCWTFTFNGSTGIGVEKKLNDYIPKVGDILTLWGKGFGYRVRGLRVNDSVFYYRTPEQEEKHCLKELEKSKRDKIKSFNKNKNELDKKFEALPDCFKERIQNFRNKNADFRVEYESYELFCCEEAVKIANQLKTEDAIRNWKQLPYDKQKMIVPIDDGHSGNTFGCAVMLAILYVTSPEYIIKAHGALAPLVGCEAYGCH